MTITSTNREIRIAQNPNGSWSAVLYTGAKRYLYGPKASLVDLLKQIENDHPEWFVGRHD